MWRIEGRKESDVARVYIYIYTYFQEKLEISEMCICSDIVKGNATKWNKLLRRYVYRHFVQNRDSVTLSTNESNVCRMKLRERFLCLV